VKNEGKATKFDAPKTCNIRSSSSTNAEVTPTQKSSSGNLRTIILLLVELGAKAKAKKVTVMLQIG
jgi:hypothetical protein